MADTTTSVADILLQIRSNADLVALSQTTKELGMARTATAALGQDTTALDGAIAGLNRQMSTKMLELYVQNLDATIASETAAGRSAEQQIATRAMLSATIEANAAAELAKIEADARMSDATAENSLVFGQNTAVIEENTFATTVDTEATVTNTAAKEAAAVSAAGMAWQFARTEEAGRGLSMILNGEMAYGTRYLATGFRGLFELMGANPMLALGAALLALLPVIDSFLNESQQEVAAANKEMADNTEQMAKRMEEAWKHPGMAEYGIAVIEVYEKIAAAQEKVIANQDRITASADKFEEAQAKLRLAEIDSDEQAEIADAKAKGATPEQIEGIKLKYAGQRTAEQGADDTDAANRDLEEKKKDVRDKEAAKVRAQKEKDESERTMKEHQQTAQDNVDQDKANFEKQQGESQKKIAGLKQEQKAAIASGADADLVAMQIQQAQDQIDDLKAEMKQRKEAYDNQQKSASAAQGQASAADAAKLAKANEDLAKAAADLEVAVNNMKTAQVNAQTATVKAGTATATQQGDQAAFDREQAQKKAQSQAETSNEANDQGIIDAVKSGKLAPTTKNPGETDKDFAKRQQEYNQVATQLEKAAATAEQNHGGSAEEFQRILDLMKRLLVIVDPGQRKNVINEGRIVEIERKVALMESQLKNNRVGG